MPTLRHWITQYTIAVVVIFMVLFAVDLLSGETLSNAGISASLWAALSAFLFVGVRYRNMKQKRKCQVCEVLDKVG